MEINYSNYLELKESGLTRAKIAEAFGMPEWSLKKLIAKNGWGKIAPTINNELVFSEYTEESCYWAGFLAADGNTDSKNRIRLILNYDDTAHIQKFKDFVGSTHKLSSNTSGRYYKSSLEFVSRRIKEDLEVNFLVTSNKTFTLEFPSFLNSEELRHYIRGYLDGDGTICESFSNVNSKTATIYSGFCCGSKQFAHDLYEHIYFELDISGTVQEFENKINIKYCTNASKILLDYLYKDSKVYLERKYNLYRKLIINDDRTTR